MLQTLSHFFAAKSPEGWRGAEVCYRAQRRRIGEKCTGTVVQPLDRPQNMKNGLKFSDVNSCSLASVIIISRKIIFSNLSKTNKNYYNKFSAYRRGRGINFCASPFIFRKLIYRCKFLIFFVVTTRVRSMRNTYTSPYFPCTLSSPFFYFLHRSLLSLLSYLQRCKKGRCVATLKCISPGRSLTVMACIVSSKQASIVRQMVAENVAYNL